MTGAEGTDEGGWILLIVGDVDEGPASALRVSIAPWQ